MSKIILFTASILGALAVAIGAFGAHSLRDQLISNDTVSAFETASQYHFYHTLALLIIGYFMRRYDSSALKSSALCIALGTIVFSGSLYILSLTDLSFFGAITPIGGLLLIFGWILLAISVFRKL